MALLWGVKLKLKKDEEAASRKGSMVVNEAKTSFKASENVISEGEFKNSLLSGNNIKSEGGQVDPGDFNGPDQKVEYDLVVDSPKGNFSPTEGKFDKVR